MLQNIRDKAQGTVAKILVALIVVPFAIFGIESLVGSGGPVEVAKVNGDKITEQELQQAINVQKQQLLAKMGENIRPEMLDEATLREPALESLITQRLLQKNATEMKLSVPAQLVDQTILSIAAFQNDGKFSPVLYQALLQNQGYTPAYFKHMLQQELVANQLHSGLSESEFVTSKELERVAAMLQQQRSFDYVTVSLATLADKVAPDSNAIESYYKSHQDQFLNPERIKLDYIELRAEDFAPALDDSALQAEFDREIAAMKPTTERRAAHILIEINKERNVQQAREQAESILKKVAAGEDFSTLAGQYSDDIGSKNSGGDLGLSDGTVFPPLFEETLAKLKAGEVSAPIPTDDGIELLKLVDVNTKPLPTFAERKNEIAQRLLREKAQPTLIKTVEKLRDIVFNSDGLQGPAGELNLSVKQSDWLERGNKDPLFGNEKVIAAAFSPEVLKERNNSDVIELSADHYIVVRIKEHAEAAPKPLEMVSSDIVKTLKQEQALEQSKQITADIIKRVAAGDEFKKAVADAGYTLKSVEKATRSNSGVPIELLRTAFGLPRPQSGKPLPTDTVSTANGDFVLLRLSEVVEGQSNSLSDIQRSAIIAQLRQGFGSADFAYFMESLRAEAEIKRH